MTEKEDVVSNTTTIRREREMRDITSSSVIQQLLLVLRDKETGEEYSCCNEYINLFKLDDNKIKLLYFLYLKGFSYNREISKTLSIDVHNTDNFLSEFLSDDVIVRLKEDKETNRFKNLLEQSGNNAPREHIKFYGLNKKFDIPLIPFLAAKRLNSKDLQKIENFKREVDVIQSKKEALRAQRLKQKHDIKKEREEFEAFKLKCDKALVEHHFTLEQMLEYIKNSSDNKFKGSAALKEFTDMLRRQAGDRWENYIKTRRLKP